MSSDVSLHVLYKIANAPIRLFPFPHIFVEEVFPWDFYREIRAHLPPPEVFKTPKALKRVYGDYPESRLVLPLDRDNLGEVAEPFRSFWAGVSSWLLNGNLGPRIMPKFHTFFEQRFGDVPSRQFHDEAMLVQDYTTYRLGPHTDSPQKALSMLFYLPPDDSQAHLGTSIYVPKQPEFTCHGMTHHPYEQFHRAFTMPYLPNTLFGFPKTHTSFHGVEPITETKVRRDLLLYDIKVTNPPELEAPAAPSAAAASVKFSF
jgi:hypothetical protein